MNCTKLKPHAFHWVDKESFLQKFSLENDWFSKQSSTLWHSKFTGGNPKIFIGSALEEKTENDANASLPFYITLTIHEQMIHNCLLDSKASHNLMPKEVLEALGLSITKPYHDLYAFNSRAVKCLGVIKDMVVSLA